MSIDLKDEDFEGYGAEMIDLVGTVKQQANEIKDRAKEINDLKGQVETVSQDVSESNEDKFYASLTEIVPDWRTINKNQGWLKWLAEIDPLTNATRQALLDNAFSALDVSRVATFFNSFKGGGGPVSSPSDSVSKGTYTTVDVTRAAKDYQTGRITEQEFDKVANAVQRSIQG